MPPEQVNQRKGAEPKPRTHGPRPTSPVLTPPESGVLGLQQTAGNAATADVMAAKSTSPGPDIAQVIRAAQSASYHAQIRSLLGLLESARAHLSSAAGMLMAPELYGAWVDMSQPAIGMLGGADSILAIAQRQRERSDGPAWVEGPEEARASSFLDRELETLTIKLIEWRARLQSVAPMDMGTPISVMNDMANTSVMVTIGLDMSERAAQG